MIFYINSSTTQITSSSSFKQNSIFYNKTDNTLKLLVGRGYTESINQFFYYQDLFCSSSQLLQFQGTILESPIDEEDILELQIETELISGT